MKDDFNYMKLLAVLSGVSIIASVVQIAVLEISRMSNTVGTEQFVNGFGGTAVIVLAVSVLIFVTALIND